jgi:MFS family permease
VNLVLARLGYPKLQEMPAETGQQVSSRGAFAALFTPKYLAATISIWLCFVMVMCGWYFVVNWTPKILVDAGLSLDQGISGGVLLSLGGVVGGLTLGYLAARVSVHRLVAAFMLMAAATMALFGQLETNLTLMLAVAFSIGFFLAGSMIGLYAIVPDIYPSPIRTTGTGWALGIGRIGAVTGPYIAGLLIAAGWERSIYYGAMGLPLLVSMVLVLRMGVRAQRPAS